MQLVLFNSAGRGNNGYRAAAAATRLACHGSFPPDYFCGGVAARKRSSKIGPKIRLTGLTGLTAAVDSLSPVDRLFGS